MAQRYGLEAKIDKGANATAFQASLEVSAMPFVRDLWHGRVRGACSLSHGLVDAISTVAVV